MSKRPSVVVGGRAKASGSLRLKIDHDLAMRWGDENDQVQKNAKKQSDANCALTPSQQLNRGWSPPPHAFRMYLAPIFA